MYELMHKNDNQYLRCRDGVYYFVRRVPNDLKDIYTSDRISMSLKTKLITTARRVAKSIDQRLEDYWMGIRLQKIDIPAIQLLQPDKLANDNSPTLSDAVELYLKLKSKNKDKVFIRTSYRNVRYVIQALGDRPINSYSTADAAKFRDWLLGKDMVMNTVKRVFSSVRSIINITKSEYGIEGQNAFSRTYWPETDDSETRKPLPTDLIRKVQTVCKETDDDLRWLVALISDTGMRLGEATGLLKSDIILDKDIPHINLQPHSWRRLKTKASERQIPLVGISLWAAKKIKNFQTENPFAFPRYCNGFGCNANSASAALNKWMKESTGNGYVLHSFRHSMRDRLRNVECPSEIIDQIGGWTRESIGEGYGKGHALELKYKWIKKLSN